MFHVGTSNNSLESRADPISFSGRCRKGGGMILWHAGITDRPESNDRGGVADVPQKMKAFFTLTRLFGISLALLLFMTPPLAAETGYVVGLSVYPLRDTPQFSSPAVARLPVGEKVTIVEEQSGWIKVRTGKITGWMPESVIGRKSPPSIQLEPLRQRVKELDGTVDRLKEENSTLREDNEGLSKRADSLGSELEGARTTASSARSYQRFWGVALGGGLVIFGWITGFALASISRRRGTKQKYRFD